MLWSVLQNIKCEMDGRRFCSLFINLRRKCVSHLFAGLYGNDDLHNGLLEVLTAGRKVDNIISMVRNQTHKLENTLSNNIQPQLAELRDIFDGPASNQTALSQLILSLTNVQENVTAATNAAGDIRRPLMQVTMTSFLAVKVFPGTLQNPIDQFTPNISICRKVINGNWSDGQERLPCWPCCWCCAQSYWLALLVIRAGKTVQKIDLKTKIEYSDFPISAPWFSLASAVY